MIDWATVIVEELFELLGRRVRIESAQYAGSAAEGVLAWVGPDPLVGAWCAHVEGDIVGVTRYVPLANIRFYAEAS